MKIYYYRRKKLLLISISILFYSANIYSQSLSTQNEFKISNFYKEQIFNTDTFISDTIQLYDYRLIFNTIDSIEYFSTLNNYYQFIDYPGIEQLIANNKEYKISAIARDNFINYDDSIFRINLGDSIYSLPKYITGYVDRTKYLIENSYYGFISELGWFVFWEGGMYGGGGFFAIDIKSGERKEFCGFPKYSPNKDLILSSYYDFETIFLDRGFYLYELKEKKLGNEIFHHDPYWGFEGTIWKDNSTIYFIRIEFSSGKQHNYIRHFMSMKFEENINH